MLKIGSINENREITKEFYRQGEIFKDEEAFVNKEGVCYVSESNDYRYDYYDFLEIANGNEKIAKFLFESVDWQSPEALYYDSINSSEIKECDKCGVSYITNGNADMSCPDCEAKEKAIDIIDFFEEILEEHNIKIPDEFREGNEEEACIFGQTYYELEDKIKKYLKERF